MLADWARGALDRRPAGPNLRFRVSPHGVNRANVSLVGHRRRFQPFVRRVWRVSGDGDVVDHSQLRVAAVSSTTSSSVIE